MVAQERESVVPVPDALTIACFEGVHDTLVRQLSLSWPSLVELLSAHETRGIKDGPLWSPTIYTLPHRASRYVKAVTCLVFDCDHGEPEWERLAPYAFVAYTTFQSTPQDQRWRIVVPLCEPVAAAQWRTFWERARAMLAPSSDPACKDASRFYYLPTALVGQTGQVRTQDGNAFDIAALPDGLVDDAPFANIPPVRRLVEQGDERPGDRFNREATWAEVLVPHGWERGRDDQGREVWIRPGKGSKDARSANTTPDGNLWIWSSEAHPFQAQKSYTKFAAYALLNFDGDLQAAGKALAQRYTPPSAVLRFPGVGTTVDNAPSQSRWPEPLSQAALYGIAGDFVRLVSPHTEADEAALLLQFLVTFGVVAGRGPHMLMEQTRHGLNEFCAIVGDTAKARKGTSIRHVAHLFELALHDTPHKLADSQRRDGLSSGEGLIWAVRDPIYKQEPSKDRTTGAVVYNRVLADEGVADKRLLVEEGELASTLKVLARDGNTLSPIIRKAWDGNTTLTSLTKNFPAVATNPHIGIIGHITRDELRRDLGKVEGANGFANRFLWVCVKRSKELPDGGRLADSELWPLAVRLRTAIDFARQEQTLARDETAAQAWRDVYHDLSEGKPGFVGAVTARSEAHVMRLSGLFATLDLSPVIRIEHLVAALLVWNYCDESADVIFGEDSSHQQQVLGDPVENKIRNALIDAGTAGLTKNELRNALSRNIPAQHIQQALEHLERNSAVRCVREKGGVGRPAERWVLCID